jgi:hypothetical protein
MPLVLVPTTEKGKSRIRGLREKRPERGLEPKCGEEPDPINQFDGIVRAKPLEYGRTQRHRE